MTPLDINKNIAILKKIGIEYADNQTGTIIDSNEVGHNWAERIEDAWELFEEMPNSFSISSLHNGFYAAYSYIYNPPIMEVEKTTPLAICKAWLKWKGIEIE